MNTPLESLDSVIATIIRERQGAADVTTAALSTQVGIERGTMMRIRKGTRAVTLGELKKIASALGTTALSVVEEAEARIK